MKKETKKPDTGEEKHVMQWQLCPKCNGQGIVSKPPGVAGDVQEWSSSSAAHVCDVCNGAKVLAIFSHAPISGDAPKESLEEVAVRFASEDDWSADINIYGSLKSGFIAGTPCQHKVTQAETVELLVKLIEDRKERLDMRIDTMWELDDLITAIKQLKA